MTKSITISFALASVLFANETTTLESMRVTANDEKPISQSIESAIADEVGVDLKRTTGKIQEIAIRGMDAENISITADGTTTHGACPNRMDPPLAHLISSKIKRIDVIKGPYNVRSLGAMGGSAEAISKDLPDQTRLEISGAYASYNKTDLQLYAGAGNDQFGIAIGAQKQSSDIYKDGGGNYITDKVGMPKYKNNITDKKLYDKQGAFVQAGFVAGGIKTEIGYDYISTDHALFPNKMMDETKTDTTQKSISLETDQELKIKIYENFVDHVMDNHTFRNGTMKTDAKGDSTTKGAKISQKYSADRNSYEIGAEYMSREWEIGRYNATTGVLNPKGMMVDAKTTAISGFGVANIELQTDNKIEIGARVDSVTIKDNNRFSKASIESIGNKYDDQLKDTLFGGYLKNEQKFGSLTFVAGIGSLQRLIAPNEAYIQQFAAGAVKGTQGNPHLKSPRNTQIDVSLEEKNSDYKAKVEAYYSILSDHIYEAKVDAANKTYTNIDAKMMGIEAKGQYFVTNDFSLKASVAYQEGKKDKSIGGSKNLANIPPIRYSLHALYEAYNLKLSVEMEAATKDSKNDESLNEVDMKSYEVFNIRGEYKLNKNFTAIAGVENLFDKEYAQYNSYSPDPINPTTVVLPEAGRTLYAAVKYKY